VLNYCISVLTGPGLISSPAISVRSDPGLISAQIISVHTAPAVLIRAQAISVRSGPAGLKHKCSSYSILVLTSRGLTTAQAISVLAGPGLIKKLSYVSSIRSMSDMFKLKAWFTM
jgi:hypothetical protein